MHLTNSPSASKMQEMKVKHIDKFPVLTLMDHLVAAMDRSNERFLWGNKIQYQTGPRHGQQLALAQRAK